MLTQSTSDQPHTEHKQTPESQRNFVETLAFWQVAAMDTRQHPQVLMSELTCISAQQDHLKMAIAEAMADAGDALMIRPLKSFKLHEKEAQQFDEEDWAPDSPGIQAGWVEPEATPQVSFLITSTHEAKHLLYIIPTRPKGAYLE